MRALRASDHDEAKDEENEVRRTGLQLLPLLFKGAGAFQKHRERFALEGRNQTKSVWENRRLCEKAKPPAVTGGWRQSSPPGKWWQMEAAGVLWSPKTALFR
jgi:hypothetical protein